jgi:hypothetical protein
MQLVLINSSQIKQLDPEVRQVAAAEIAAEIEAAMKGQRLAVPTGMIESFGGKVQKWVF